jgi:hypothetical protein
MHVLLTYQLVSEMTIYITEASNLCGQTILNLELGLTTPK